MITRIKEYRTRQGLTQEDLAKAVGVRRETIVFLEQGKYNPSLRLAHDIARALHAGIDDLFIFDDDEPEPESPEQRVVLID
jgi:putative transcriptional regulator